MPELTAINQAKDFLVLKGHRPADLDKLSWVDRRAFLKSIMLLHGLEAHEFRHYGMGRDLDE